MRTPSRLALATLLVLAVVQGGCAQTKDQATAQPSVDASETATTATPSATASPTATPSPTASPPEYCQPESVPYQGESLAKSLTLSAADVGSDWQLYTDVGGFQPYRNCYGGVPARLDLCGDHHEYQADRHRLAGRLRSYTAGPETGAAEILTQFEPGQAAAFLTEVRQRVDSCRQRPDFQFSGTTYTSVIDTGFAGDDSVLIYSGSEPSPPAYPESFLAVVRVGDYIIVIDNSFDLGSNDAMSRSLATKAVARLG